MKKSDFSEAPEQQLSNKVKTDIKEEKGYKQIQHLDHQRYLAGYSEPHRLQRLVCPYHAL